MEEVTQYYNIIIKQDNTTEPSHQDPLTSKTHEDNPAQTTELQQMHTDIFESIKIQKYPQCPSWKDRYKYSRPI